MENVTLEHKASNVKSLTLATIVNYDDKSASKVKSLNFNPKFPYGLCHSLGENSKFNHKLYQCKHFANPQNKIWELEELKGCTRCGYLNHTV